MAFSPGAGGTGSGSGLAGVSPVAAGLVPHRHRRRGGESAAGGSGLRRPLPRSADRRQRLLRRAAGRPGDERGSRAGEPELPALAGPFPARRTEDRGLVAGADQRPHGRLRQPKLRREPAAGERLVVGRAQPPGAPRARQALPGRPDRRAGPPARPPVCRRHHRAVERRRPRHRANANRLRRRPHRQQGNLGDGLRRAQPAADHPPGAHLPDAALVA